MAGYEISFPKMKTALEHLETALKEINKEIENLESTRTTTLSNTVWKGPNKSKFEGTMTKYQNALTELYNNAKNHHVKFVDIMNKYAAQETR